MLYEVITGREPHFELVQPVAYFRPELVGIFHIVVQFNKDDHLPFFAVRVRFDLIDFFVTKNVIFNFFG